MSEEKNNDQKNNPFIPQQPKLDMVRRFRTRWIVDIVFATIMFGIALFSVKSNPTILYFLMSAFWFILAAWDCGKLNRALKAQPGQ